MPDLAPQPAAEPDYAAMDDAALEALMASGAALVPVPETKPEEPESPPEAPPEPEMPAAVPEMPAVPPAEEAEPDPFALAAERGEIQAKKFKAEMDLQRAHASRLAGQIGQLKADILRQRAEPLYEPEPVDGEAVPKSSDRLAALEAKLQASEISQAIQDQAAVGRSLMPQDATPAELAEAAKPYVERWQEAMQSPNAEVAGEIARAIFAGIAANLEETRYLSRLGAAKEKRATQMAEAVQRKKEAGISGSDGAAVPRAKPKSYDEMTGDEADKELRRLYGSR